MEIYKNLAQVYDIFMEETPYEEWFKYIKKIWEENNFTPNSVLEIGCGTGSITTLLAEENFNTIGIDNSPEMLSKAQEKAYSKCLNILYLEQDMRNFELHESVDCILSICDSLNYILETKEILQIFNLVNKYLNKGGFFIFDLNTIYKFENILGCNSFSETTETSAYTIENFYEKSEKISEFYTNLFIKDEKTNMYKRYEETHYEKGYEIEEIKDLLKKSNLEFINVYDNLKFTKPSKTSERIFFIAKKI